MKKYLFLIFALFIFIPKVNADTLPSFNLRVEENQNFNLQMFSDRTYLEFFDEIISYDSEYYDILINPVVLNSDSTSYRIQLGLIPKGVPFPLSSLSYSESGADFFIGYTFPFSSYKYYSISPNVNLSVNNINDYNNFKNCYLNGVCSSYNQYNIQSSFYKGRYYSSSNSYDNELAQKGYVIYSSLPIPITYSSNFSSKFSSFSVNNTLIENGDYIPTYYDIFYTEPEPDYNLSSVDSILNMLVGNITDLYTFRLNLKFNYSNYNYINSMTANYRLYARKSNLDSNDNLLYYSYDDITSSCGAINQHVLDKTITQVDNYAEFNYFSQGISCGNLDLTQYDYFYLDIQTFSTTNDEYLVSDLSYYSTSGYIDFPSSHNYNIYDTFVSLPNDFSILLTTDYSYRNVKYITNNKYVLGCPTNIVKTEVSQGCYNPSSIGSSGNYGYMIYKYPDSEVSTVDLSILLSYDTIVSFPNNNTYSYYSGDIIVNGDIDNRVVLNYNTNKYDISYYINYINDFLEDFRDDINSFAFLVQNFYDTMPVYFQTFIYCSFILLLTWALYLLIRRF